MNLRIIPAVPTAPTVIFSLNWHNLPSSLPFPHFYSTQLVSCQDSSIPTPRNTLAFDRAVGVTLLIDAVTFDLAKEVVVVNCVDGQVFEWSVNDSAGFKDALESVLQCVKDSGVEAEKEKKAAAALASGSANGTPAPAPSTTTTGQATPAGNGTVNGKKHRTASGIFSSFVAAFVTPPPSTLPATNVPADTPPHLAHLYAFRARRKAAAPTYHRQHILNPRNQRDQFTAAPVPQSRYLRRQARAKLVDVFRLYVASRLADKMRAQGIIGEELKTRGVLDDLEDSESSDESEVAHSGVSGYQAAGGYVGFMARSMLKKTITEFNKEDEDSYSSSDESSLLTPRDDTNNSIMIPDLPSSYEDAKSTPARVASPTPSAVRARRPSSPRLASHSQKIRHLSSVLIGLAQKDKRAIDDERQMDQIALERSLRKRWSASEQSGLVASRSRIFSDAASRTSASKHDFAKPVIASPLRTTEVFFHIPVAKKVAPVVIEAPIPRRAIDVPFPANGLIPRPSAPRRSSSLPPRIPSPPVDEDAEDARELATRKTSSSSVSVSSKAKEAEDAVNMIESALLMDAAGSASGRARCTAMLADSVPSVPAPSRRKSNPGMIMSTIPEVASEAFPVDATDAFEGEESFSQSFRSYTDSFPATPSSESTNGSVKTSPAHSYTPAPEPTSSAVVDSPFRYAYAPRATSPPVSPNSKTTSFADVLPSMQVEIEFHSSREYETDGIRGRPDVAGPTYWSGVHDGIYVV